MHKKKMMRDLVLTDIDKRIHHIVDTKPYSVITHRKNSIVASYVPLEGKEKDTKPNIQQEIQQIKRGVVGDLRRSFVPRQENKPDSFVPRTDSFVPRTEKPDSFVPRTEKPDSFVPRQENKLESLVQSTGPEQPTIVQKITEIDTSETNVTEVKKGIVGDLKRIFVARQESLSPKEKESQDQDLLPTVTSDLQVILKE
jgi:hypothetical protein